MKTEMFKSLAPEWENVLTTVREKELVRRMFEIDPSVWCDDESTHPEIRQRLGWLTAHQVTALKVDTFKRIADELQAEGIKKILLLGMGGSSLAPEVIAQAFAPLNGLELMIVDSTDPGQVLTADAAHDPQETLYIVSSKSGGTAEVRAFLDYFYARCESVLGVAAGSHFIAITDPGTGLEKTAQNLNFREIIISDPNVGGRFSALTPFGVFPAVLMSLDAEKILAKADQAALLCSAQTILSENPGALLGAYMFAAAKNGRDKLTVLTDDQFASFGSWMEQLVAESSGKSGKGIVPIDLEPLLVAEKYGSDRTFVYLNFSGSRRALVDMLIQANQPVYEIMLTDRYDLFAQFFIWEIAVSLACALLRVNAFDQPNVQDSKTRTVAKIDEYYADGKLTELPIVWEKDGFSVSCALGSVVDLSAATIQDVIHTFVDCATCGTDYIALNAYLPRNESTTADLQHLRKAILERTGCATTLGFGPRFQHSTGQLHKGGANNGLFIQIVADCPMDCEIPNENMTFSVLERAQALGDFESLVANDRRAIRINLGSHGVADLLK